MIRYCSFARVLILCGPLLCGCAKSSSTGSSNGTASHSSSSKPADFASTNSGHAITKEKSDATQEFWEGYPDVPKVKIMTEVDGITIPRMPTGKQTLQLTGEIPADVGNDRAKGKSNEPVTGDTLTVRFNAEPKVLNPMTENSAVMRYIMQYVNENLFNRNWETFEYEPWMAKTFVAEDSIKLSADCPQRERRVTIKGGPPQSTFEIDYVLPAPVDGKPAEGPRIVMTTTDKDGKPLGHVWVGLYPVGRIPGAPKTGYHNWSNDQGHLDLVGFPTGKYVVKTGDEVFGLAARQPDGSLIVAAGTAENPIKEPVQFKQGEWQEIQEKTYTTLYLRDDVTWSDGAPFTTKDLEFGYALLNSPFVDGDSIRTYYSDLVECTALGPHAIRLRYRQQYFKAPEFTFEMSSYLPPFHFFESLFRSEGRQLTLDSLTPEEEAARKQISARGQEFGKFFNTDERYNSKPLGTGPYVIDKWERKDRVELVRNPHYWNPSKAGHVDRIIFKFIPDQVTAFAAMKAGEIDFLYDMSPDQYFEAWPNLDREIQDTYIRSAWFSPQFSYIGWNQLATPFKDRRVRLAMTMLFDRQEFVDKKLHGAAILVSGSEYLFGMGYDQDVAPIGYDPEVARDLLTEAGWIDTDNDGIRDRNGEKFQITLRMPKGKPINEQMVEVIQKNCKNVGIDLQIQTMEWASFIDKYKAKECDAIALRWTITPESDPFQIWHSSEGTREKRGSNTVSFRNQQADEFIELLRMTLDEGKRRRIHQSLHRVIDSEQPYTFLWIVKELGAYHKRFRNVKWYRLRPGFQLSEWYVPKDEQLHK